MIKAEYKTCFRVSRVCLPESSRFCLIRTLLVSHDCILFQPQLTNQDQITDSGAANHQRHSWRSGSKHDNPSFRRQEDEKLVTLVWGTGFAGVRLKPQFVTKDRSLKRKKRQLKGLKRQKPVGRRDRLWEKRWLPVSSSWHQLPWAPAGSKDGFVFPGTGCCTLTTHLLFLKLAWVSFATK